MGAEGAQASLAIGERIKQSRAAAGLSQEALAQLVGVSRQTVSNWERSRTTPDAYALKRIAETFGISAAGLLLGAATSSNVQLLLGAAVMLGPAAIAFSWEHGKNSSSAPRAKEA